MSSNSMLKATSPSGIDTRAPSRLEFTHMRSMVLALTAIILGCGLVQAQSTPPARQDSRSKPSDAAKPELQNVRPEAPSDASTLTLKDAGHLSPEESARMVAKSLGEKKDQSKRQAAGQSEAATDQAVVEFHPAADGSRNGSGAAAKIQDKQPKSALKWVHGDLYGAKSGTGHAGGGSIGATSRSGKTSVYVQSDQARSTAPQPR